jgi:hypothetical protein
MEMTRRMFTKQTGAGILVLAAGGAAIALEGCSVSNVFTDVVNWEPVGKAAVQGIITLLQGAGLVSPGIGLLIPVILAGFDELLVDVKTYQALNPPPAGALAKIVVVFNLIVSNFQDMLAQLNVTANPIITTVVGLAQIIIGTIAGFIGKLPTAAGKVLGNTFKVGGQMIAYVPQARTRRAFKKDFNRVAVAGGHPEIQLHVTFFEHF